MGKLIFTGILLAFGVYYLHGWYYGRMNVQRDKNKTYVGNLMREAYVKGQVDFMKGRTNVKKLNECEFVLIKSPWGGEIINDTIEIIER